MVSDSQSYHNSVIVSGVFVKVGSVLKKGKVGKFCLAPNSSSLIVWLSLGIRDFDLLSILRSGKTSGDVGLTCRC